MRNNNKNLTILHLVILDYAGEIKEGWKRVKGYSTVVLGLFIYWYYVGALVYGLCMGIFSPGRIVCVRVYHWRSVSGFFHLADVSGKIGKDASFMPSYPGRKNSVCQNRVSVKGWGAYAFLCPGRDCLAVFAGDISVFYNRNWLVDVFLF